MSLRFLLASLSLPFGPLWRPFDLLGLLLVPFGFPLISLASLWLRPAFASLGPRCCQWLGPRCCQWRCFVTQQIVFRLVLVLAVCAFFCGFRLRCFCYVLHAFLCAFCRSFVFFGVSQRGVNLLSRMVPIANVDGGTRWVNLHS